MNHLNVIPSNKVTVPKLTLISTFLNQLKTKIQKLFKSAGNLISEIGDYIQQKNIEAAMIEHRSADQMEKRYGPNWITMRGFY